jgi:penicillin-binding protein A
VPPEATLPRVVTQQGRGVRRPGPRARPAAARRRALLLKVAGVLAGVAFGTGLVCGAIHVPEAERTAERYVAAWARGDFAAMYAALTPGARARVTRRAFAGAHRRALALATAEQIVPGDAARDGAAYRIPIQIDTRVFGTVRQVLRVPVADDGVRWTRTLLFPGLRPGEDLTRTVTLPPRATILARDGTPLAEGEQRTSPLGSLAASIAGTLGPIPPARRISLERLGVPARAQVGINGLERIFDERLIGRPGGILRAGRRVIGAGPPRPAPPVRTTLAVPVQRAAVTALGARLGGVVALDPRNGGVLAAAGIGFSGLQPPGSTFKMLTVTGALDAGITRPARIYPVETHATLEGVELGNANGEACGGTLVEAFAESCNSVFAPMGAQLGARRLVATAERFGFNADPGIPGAATSTIPAPDAIGDDLAVGATAIGQGRVQASALQMAVVAATIARRGLRPRPTLDRAVARSDRRPAPVRVTSPRTAQTVRRLMRAVVHEGTGTAAALPGVEVAGKTGTAELRDTTPCVPDPADPASCPPQAETDITDTDAWFAAFAPAGGKRPRVAVGVLLVESGAGGDAAAPAAREILAAGLAATN